MEEEGVLWGIAEGEMEGGLRGGGVALGVLDEGKVGEKTGVGVEAMLFENGEARLFLELTGEPDPEGWEENGGKAGSDEQGCEAAAK